MSLTIKISYPTQFYRIPHDVERVRMYVTEGEADLRYAGNRNGSVRKSVIDKGAALPEVYRAYPDHQTSLNASFQWLWRNLNSELDDERWTALGDGKLAWTNGTGFDTRRNWVTLHNMDAKDAAFDAPRFCGGAVVEGERVDNRVYIRSILISNPVPTSVDKTLWYYGTSVNPSGEVNLITRVGIDGERKAARIPIITRLPIFLPADELHALPKGFFPDPKWMP